MLHGYIVSVFCPFFWSIFTFNFVKTETYKHGRKTDTEIGPNKLHAWNHSLYGRKNGCQISLNLSVFTSWSKGWPETDLCSQLVRHPYPFWFCFYGVAPFWERPESMSPSSLTFLLNLRKSLLNLDKKIEKTWPEIAIFGNFGRNMVKKRKLDLKLRKLKILCLKLTRNWWKIWKFRLKSIKN